MALGGYRAPSGRAVGVAVSNPGRCPGLNNHGLSARKARVDLILRRQNDDLEGAGWHLEGSRRVRVPPASRLLPMLLHCSTETQHDTQRIRTGQAPRRRLRRATREVRPGSCRDVGRRPERFCAREPDGLPEPDAVCPFRPGGCPFRPRLSRARRSGRTIQTRHRSVSSAGRMHDLVGCPFRPPIGEGRLLRRPERRKRRMRHPKRRQGRRGGRKGQFLGRKGRIGGGGVQSRGLRNRKQGRKGQQGRQGQ